MVKILDRDVYQRGENVPVCTYNGAAKAIKGVKKNLFK